MKSKAVRERSCFPLTHSLSLETLLSQNTDSNDHLEHLVPTWLGASGEDTAHFHQPRTPAWRGHQELRNLSSFQKMQGHGMHEAGFPSFKQSCWPPACCKTIRRNWGKKKKGLQVRLSTQHPSISSCLCWFFLESHSHLAAEVWSIHNCSLKPSDKISRQRHAHT